MAAMFIILTSKLNRCIAVFSDESFPVDSIAGVIRAHLLGPGSFYPGQLSDGSQNVVGYQGDRDSLNDFDLSDFNNALLEKLKTTGRVNGYSSLFPDQGIQGVWLISYYI